jgi:hypothetical protein
MLKIRGAKRVVRVLEDIRFLRKNPARLLGRTKVHSEGRVRHPSKSSSTESRKVLIGKNKKSPGIFARAFAI